MRGAVGPEGGLEYLPLPVHQMRPVGTKDLINSLFYLFIIKV